MKTEAVGYARVSLEEQVHSGLSLDDQESRIRRYADLCDLPLAEIIRDEGVSGTKPLATRPGGRRLVKASTGASHVIAVKLDRLFRNVGDCLGTIDDWDRRGTHLHLVDFGGQAVNTGTAVGRLFVTMVSGFAAFERDLIAERTSAALIYRRSQLKPFSRDPFGWKAIDGVLVPVAEEQQVLCWIQKRRSEGAAFGAIARELNLGGVRSKRGSRWYASSVRSVLGVRPGEP